MSKGEMEGAGAILERAESTKEQSEEVEGVGEDVREMEPKKSAKKGGGFSFASLGSRLGTLRSVASRITAGTPSEVSDERLLSNAFDVSTLNRASLEVNLRKRGLDTTGSKAELRQRLLEWIADRVEGDLARKAHETASRIREVRQEESGSVYACGVNHRGQLGMGDREAREIFTCIPKLKGRAVDSVAAGVDYCFAVTESREVFAWGGEGNAPLGTPSAIASTLRMEGGGEGGKGGEDERYEVLTPGYRSKLPRSVAVDREEPWLQPEVVMRLRGEGIVEVACGFRHVAAVSEGGDVFVWGSGRSGQLGTGGFEEEVEPTIATSIEDKIVDSIAVGHSHTLALLANGEALAWGSADSGKLGVGAEVRIGVPKRYQGFFPAPTPITLPRLVKQVACSSLHSIALLEAAHGPDVNMVYTWGSGAGGRLGHGDLGDRLEPTPVEALQGERVLQVACGVWTSAAIVETPPLRDGGFVYTWGTGTTGQLGLGDVKNTARTPEIVSAFVDRGITVREVICGAHHTAAISTDNDLFTWGSNRFGCLGAAIVDEMIGTPQLVEAFDVLMDGVGRGTVRSVALGNHFTIVACYPYTGPTEEEVHEAEEIIGAGGDPQKLLRATTVASMAARKDTSPASQSPLRPPSAASSSSRPNTRGTLDGEAAHPVQSMRDLKLGLDKD